MKMSRRNAVQALSTVATASAMTGTSIASCTDGPAADHVRQSPEQVRERLQQLLLDVVTACDCLVRPVRSDAHVCARSNLIAEHLSSCQLLAESLLCRMDREESLPSAQLQAFADRCRAIEQISDDQVLNSIPIAVFSDARTASLVQIAG